MSTVIKPPMLPVAKPWLGDEEITEVADAISSGWVAQGPRVAAFERVVAERVGAAHGVAVSSCTTGLHLALYALGLGRGDEVVVPSLSFIATANAARYVGATPVFADVDPDTHDVTADTIEAVITERTRAVIVVHQVGVPADLDPIHALCARHGIAVVEDAACAIGSTYRGAPIGAHSQQVVFSFHPRKVITTGEGGMITTNDGELAARLTRLRQHGMTMSAADRHAATTRAVESYLETGFNFRLCDVQAAIGLVQMRRLDALLARRRELAERYLAAFRDVPGIRAFGDPAYGTTNFQSFVIEVGPAYGATRDELIDELLDHGISPRRGIMAAHLEPAYAGHPHAPLPVTEHVTASTLILPLFHDLAPGDQDRVIAVVQGAHR